MAENIPPTANSAVAAPPSADQPGRPYYESLRTSLRATLDKKRKLDDALTAIEDQIFKAEGTYLEDTAGSGNIVRGFDGWVKGVQVGRGGVDGDRRRGGRVRDEERVFSRSSVGWMRAQEVSDSNTPSHAATPTGNFAAPSLVARNSDTASQAGTTKNKKRRPAADKDNDEESSKSKRGKITYARD
nr:chromatin modification-related protein eaf6 [Quercus suber]